MPLIATSDCGSSGGAPLLSVARAHLITCSSLRGCSSTLAARNNAHCAMSYIKKQSSVSGSKNSL